MKKLKVNRPNIGFFAKHGLLSYINPEDRDEAMEKVLPYINNGDYEFKDNFRMADNLNKDKYDEILNKGCCGYLDIEFKVKSGRTIYFGFNYGH